MQTINSEVLIPTELREQVIDDSLNERASYSTLENYENPEFEPSYDSFNDRAEEYDDQYDNSQEFSVEDNKSSDSLNFEEKQYIELIKSQIVEHQQSEIDKLSKNLTFYGGTNQKKFVLEDYINEYDDKTYSFVDSLEKIPSIYEEYEKIEKEIDL